MKTNLLSLVLLTFFTPLININSAKSQTEGSPFAGLKDYAKSVTLGVLTPGSGGSAVIIGKKEKTYYFLTSSHLIQGNPTREEYWVYSLLGNADKKYKVQELFKPDKFSGKDLAIGSFKSDQEMQVALIFPLDIEEFVPLPPKLPGVTFRNIGSLNERRIDKEWDIQGPPVVAGISLPTNAVTVPIFRSSAAEMQPRAKGNQNGFEALYTAVSTVPGMSGGGLFAARTCPPVNQYGSEFIPGAYPGLIAIHGMSEKYGDGLGRSGVSLGVPLDLVANYLGKNAGKFGIPVGIVYYQKVIQMCSSKQVLK